MFVVKAATSPLVLPSPVPFCGPYRGETLEHIIVSDPNGIALDHDIEPCVPGVAASHQNHARVPMKVLGLLFGGTRGEVESPIEPHGNQRSNMGTTVCPDGRDPKQFGGFKHTTCLIPWRGNCARVAEARVDARHGFVHEKVPFNRSVMGKGRSFFSCFI